jgi:hypothetical protein
VSTTSPEAKATSDLISRLRGSVIPAAESGTTMHIYVGGITAIFGDFATVIGHKLPLFIASANSASDSPPRSCSTRSSCAPSSSLP